MPIPVCQFWYVNPGMPILVCQFWFKVAVKAAERDTEDAVEAEEDPGRKKKRPVTPKNTQTTTTEKLKEDIAEKVTTFSL